MGALVIDAMAEAQGSAEGNDEGAIVAALERLSRVGLGEVWSYHRTPAQLSEGQRWRLRLALALARARPASGKPLCILALRKAVSARPDLCAIVVTSHEDLTAALDPDLIVQCDFGLFNLLERGSS